MLGIFPYFLGPILNLEQVFQCLRETNPLFPLFFCGMDAQSAFNCCHVM